MKIFTDLRFRREHSQILSEIRKVLKGQEEIMATQADTLTAIASVSSQLTALEASVQTLTNRAEVPDAVITAVQGLGSQVSAIAALVPSA